MEYIDIHSHVNFAAFAEDREEVLRRAQEAAVGVINVGTQLDTSRLAVEIADSHPGVYAVIGLHPAHTSRSRYDESELGPGGSDFTARGEEFDPDRYQALLTSSRVVGVGETGLDYHHADTAEAEVIRRQKAALEAQIVFAAEHDLPLMIHCRDAYDDLLDILGSYKRQYGERLRGNSHFFAGQLDHIRRFLELGFTISFTGVVTFTSDYDELVRFVPREMIHAETDAPFVAPKPHRGKRNEPAFVRLTADRLAEIRGEDREELRPVLVDNARRLFGI